jgi:hypothetical protein
MINSSRKIVNKMLNKIGPAVEPCCTPENTEMEEENFNKTRTKKVYLISSFGTT